MCDICGMSHCPPGCPSYEGEIDGYGHVIGQCALCGETVHGGEQVLEKGGDLLCEACAEMATLDDVLAAEGVRDATELLCDCLGWRPCVY